MSRGNLALVIGASLASLALASCGGGGGGGGGGGAPGGGVTTPTPPPPPTFSSWSALQSGSTISVKGIAVETTFTATAPATPSYMGMKINAAPVEGPVEATYTQTTNASGGFTAMGLSTGKTTVGFTTAGNDVIAIQTLSLLLNSPDGQRWALLGNPVGRSWDYQSFGAWQTGVGTISGTMGGASVGANTPAATLQATGRSRFHGETTGFYTTAAGNTFRVSSQTQGTVDFGARQVSLLAFGFRNVDGMGDSNFGTNDIPGLQISLSWQPGQTRLTGTAAQSYLSAGPRPELISGTATGQFYGPTGQELGGVFDTTSRMHGGVERIFGAFGVGFEAAIP